METAPLKSFATWARTALIREVTARITVVLAPASPERVEQPRRLEALEKAVDAAGGGDVKGRAAVADRVAYTWFNRIIALRFMDANGYTGIGVVSPRAGVASGQPEILAEAKRGQFDTEVVDQRIRETVSGLLDGTRRSADPQGESYALLLVSYCRHWNRSMPFMFQREGDFTELLIPANLLADESVLSRVVKVLSGELCEDVEVIGWLYQFYISERKDEVFAGFKKNIKAGAAEIPAATQLFTPHWIVRYLVENSLGRLWMLNRPSSRLVDQMQYYVAPVDEETDFLKISSPEELRVLDPACGSGHMLSYAFDLLYAIYEEEGYAPAEIPGLILTNNLYGVEIDPRAGTLAAFALVMKARAKQRKFFNRQFWPNVCVLNPIRFTSDEIGFLLTRDGDRNVELAFWNDFDHADILGSLIQPNGDLTARLRQHLAQLDDGGDMIVADVVGRAERVALQATYLSDNYAVVIANPPYMGSGNMCSRLAEFAKRQYPDAKSDLMTMFMRRAHDLTLAGGYWAIIDLPSWMFLTTFSAFRRWLLAEASIQSMIHLGRGLFGSDFGSVAFACRKSKPGSNSSGIYRRLFEKHVAVRSSEQIRQLFLKDTYNRFEVAQSSFTSLPNEPLVYWAADKIEPAFSPGTNLSLVSYTRIGLITGDNNSYIREWYEVSHCKIGAGLTRSEAATSRLRWFPVSKGGEFRKWYGNTTSVVDWSKDGRELRTRLDPTGSRVLAHNFNLDDIFREGVTWSKVSLGRFSGRHHPMGFIFNDPSACIFPKASQVPTLALLAYLTSNVADYLLRALNPTLNFQPGNVSTLPWSAKVPIDRVTKLAGEALSLAKADWDEQETSRDFVGNFLTMNYSQCRLSKVSRIAIETFEGRAVRLASLEEENNSTFSSALGLSGALEPAVALNDVTLLTNPDWAFSNMPDRAARHRALTRRLVEELVSFAVGCMFGRYSLDEPGLILADQGASVREYLAKVSTPAFMPDDDNVIPIVGGDWFEDDIVFRFRQFLRVAFGEQHFEENLRFVTESLGVEDLRDYFLKSFYKDHVQRYKKRPIYWMFSSPKGSFNALIYMHRYTPSTVSIVLNEYLREFKAKLAASLQHQERLAAGGGTAREQASALKEADRLRKVILELDEYEHDVLYPLASQQVAIDLDDGVKVNYPKLGAALKKIPGLEAAE